MISAGIGIVSVDDDATVYSDNYVVRNNRTGTPITGGDRDTIAISDGWGPAGTHNTTFSIGGNDLGLLDYKDKASEALHTIYGYNSSSVTCTAWSIWNNLGGSHAESTLTFDPGDEKVRVSWNP